MDLYKVLGVRRDAKQNEIRKAYRKIARETHPDFHDQERITEYKAATAAYQVLGNPARRAAYDKDNRQPISLQELFSRSPGRRFLSSALPHAPAARADGEDMVVSVREEDGVVILTDPHDPNRTLQIPVPRAHKMCRVEGLGEEGKSGGSCGALYIIPAGKAGKEDG
jgi:DnaJ-class molecular chaperone